MAYLVSRCSVTIADANIKAPAGGVESSVDQFGLGILGLAGAGIVTHAAVSAIIGKKSKSKEEEKEGDKDE